MTPVTDVTQKQEVRCGERHHAITRTNSCGLHCHHCLLLHRRFCVYLLHSDEVVIRKKFYNLEALKTLLTGLLQSSSFLLASREPYHRDINHNLFTPFVSSSQARPRPWCPLRKLRRTQRREHRLHGHLDQHED